MRGDCMVTAPAFETEALLEALSIRIHNASIKYRWEKKKKKKAGHTEDMDYL